MTGAGPVHYTSAVRAEIERPQEAEFIGTVRSPRPRPVHVLKEPLGCVCFKIIPSGMMTGTRPPRELILLLSGIGRCDRPCT